MLLTLIRIIMPRIDLHCHTKYSKCSNLEPNQILKACQKNNIQGVMICDHDTMKGVKAFEEILIEKSIKTNFILIPGVEILTNQGEILGAFLEELPTTSIFPDVAEEIRERGGLVVIPHPYDRIRRKAFKLNKNDLKFIDAIEIFNSRCIMPNGNRKALEFAEEHSMLKTSGSDAHFAVEVGRAGVSFNGTTAEELRKQLELNEINYYGKTSPKLTHLLTITHRIKRTFRGILKKE
ncbi:MAG: PHP domain-containing protein [Candidatus Hodarchaeota archaeon]